MRIAIVTTYLYGGAARSAQRLHCALREAGQESTVFATAAGQDVTTRVITANRANPALQIARYLTRRRREKLNAAYLAQGGNRHEPLQLDWARDYRSLPRGLADSDVVNLHWVARFVDSRMVKKIATSIAPVVWTMHDMLPLTGGCHYDAGCGRYRQGCGCCPMLGSTNRADPTARTWQSKRKALAQVPNHRLHLVAPSRWLADCARNSPIFTGKDVSLIPHSIDTDAFAPRDKARARDSIGIRPDAKAVLLISHDIANTRKGLDQFVAAFSGSDCRVADNALVITVGAGKPDLAVTMPHRHLGEIRDDRRLSEVYSAADVFVLPSRQDNLPNTVMEAMACGTPVVGFAVGGVPDMVRSDETGILVPPGDVRGLRYAVKRILNDRDLRDRMGGRCRDVVLREYRPAVQASRYLDLFQEIATRR